MIRSLTIALLLIAPFVLAACGGTDDAHPENFDDEMAYPDDMAYAGSPDDPYAFGQHAAALSSGGAQRVTIVDRGLQMGRGTYTIPADWQLLQDVATDPSTGQTARYRLDIRGPHGELIRVLRVTNYAAVMGTSFEQTWRGLAMQGAQGEVRDLSIGGLQRSAQLESLRPFRRVAARAQQGGFRIEGLEAPLRARSDRGAVEGVVQVLHWTAPQMAGAGVVVVSLVLSPADRVAETLRLNAQIADSFQPNPAFEQRMEQINQVVAQRQRAESQQRMAQSQALHQQRMAANQAAFNAHQQSMQTLSEASDIQFQTWQNTQRSSDEMQRRTVNGIHGTADIYNSQTGETAYGVDGGYDAYWTDPSGTVVGTQGYDNPDALRYEQGTDLDDLYDQGGYDGDW